MSLLVVGNTSTIMVAVALVTACADQSSSSVWSVTVTPDPVAVAVGHTAQLTATLVDRDGNVLTDREVEWGTNDASVAVATDGLVTGVAVGSAQISAASEGQIGTATVNVVTVTVTSVTVTPQSASIQVGQMVQLTATVQDGDGNVLTDRAVMWSTSDSSVATVSSFGLVTGSAAGSVTITATSEGQSGSAAGGWACRC